MIATPPPYFAQWESRDLVGGFVTGARRAEDDPLWARSGAPDQNEYARWAAHSCGMACLKMLLAARDGIERPTYALAQENLAAGGYQITPDGDIKGLIYRPFVDYLRAAHGIAAEVRADLSIDALADAVAQGAWVIASVHPSIRHPDAPPPHKGGHLVLIHAATQTGLRFHNPSGFAPETQENVELPRATFDRFYAERGVVVYR